MRKYILAAALCTPAFMIPSEGSATAALCTTTSTLAFGNVLVGSTKSLDAVALNCGTGNTQPKGLIPTFGGATGAGFGPITAQTPSGNTPQGQTTSRSYTFTPTTRGSSTGSATLSGVTTGGSGPQLTLTPITIGLSGKGVAPVNQVSSTDAGATRIGTTGTGKVTVTNTGDGNLAGAGLGNLAGSVGAGSGAFTGAGGTVNLGDSGSVSFNYTFAPTTHGSADTTVNYAFTDGSSDGKNQAQTGSLVLHGNGVGPVFATDIPDEGLDFGTIAGGTSTQLTFHIMNTTTDLGGDSLTGLTIESAVIGGTWASLFSIDPFTPTVISKGGDITVTAHYNAPVAPGFYQDTTLTLLTDQGAAFGGIGQEFVFDLSGGTLAPLVLTDSRTAVPEPATLALLAPALLGLGLRARRRK